MDIIKVIILGIVQGLTEFLPVSSSGHLVLAAEFLNFQESGVAFEVIVHLGTLFSVLIAFRKDVWQYDHMEDYTDPQLKIPVNSYEWHWTLGEIITALSDAGLRIEFLHEFPQYFYNGYTPYDVENDRVELYPCTFSLKAVAE